MHARPLINLTAKLVKLRNINVTLLTTNDFYDRAVSELARSFVPGEEEFAKRIRYVWLCTDVERRFHSCGSMQDRVAW